MIEWLGVAGTWASVAVVVMLALAGFIMKTVKGWHDDVQGQADDDRDRSEKAHGEIKSEIKEFRKEHHSDMANVREDIDKLRTETQTEFKEARKEARSRGRELHNRLNEHERALGEMRGKLKGRKE